MSGTLAFGSLDTALGRLLVAVTETGVASLTWRDTPGTRARTATQLGLPAVDDPDRTGEALAQLKMFFGGDPHAFDLPIDWRLTNPLQRRVLETLYERVRWGQTITYGTLGERSEAGVNAQAIGQVMGSNPIPLIVPCHRVVASNGIGGYSGGSGIEVKRWLLTMEGSLPATLDWSLEDGPSAL
ncbi:methylated-DNA--[protein]-cysteine S-methyltransferase [Actinomadura gamaensis]|uniref:Methylated-DNA--protein-cysteine methyltransferase n=1 Tax=Actinomadura gamaensis TaxID=1763541 RepID=A0ABV9U698_9ACTN